MKKKQNTKNQNNNDISKYIDNYFEGAIYILFRLVKEDIKKTIEELVALKKRGGRLFILGVGGGAGNASHAVNDFRKICGIEAYAPTDNVSELTAQINDNGWESSFVNWLKGSRLEKKDAIMVFSVGGGDIKKNISVNIVRALEYAKEKQSTILGIVSRDGGYTKKVANVCILIPIISDEVITPYTESFQALIWHMIVSCPLLKV